MRKLVIALLILVLIIGGAFIYKSTITKEPIVDSEIIQEETKVEDTKVSKVENWNGDITQIDFSNLKSEGAQYEGLTPLTGSNDFATIFCIEDEVRVAVTKNIKTMIEDIDAYKFYDDDVSDFVALSSVSNMDTAYISTFGQDFWKETPVLFLTKDGTIKYDSFEKVIEDKVTLKEVSELKNVVQIYSSSICDVDEETGEIMGGAVTTIAVDKNGIAYDLYDYIKY